MYNVVIFLLHIVTVLFVGVCMEHYFSFFAERRGEGDFTEKWLVVAIYFIADCLLEFVFIGSASDSKLLVGMFGSYLIILFVAMLMYKTEHGMIWFLSLSFAAIKEICIFISMLIMVWGGKVFELYLLLMEAGYISSADMLENMIHITAGLLQVMMNMIFAILFFYCLKNIIKNYREKDYKIHRAELWMLLIPGLVGFGLCAFLRTVYFVTDDNVQQTLYEKYPILMIIIPIILMLTLLSIVFSVKVFQDMIALQKERSNRIILEKQVCNMQEYIKQMQHIYSGVRCMKHDMKNIISVILQLVLKENNRNTELDTYLVELNRTMDSLEFQYKTGNGVADILLNSKYHEAKRAIPILQMEAENLVLGDKLHIRSYDIGIILGNALDNAIEACKKIYEKNKNEKCIIILSAYQKGKMFFIEVENSFDGKVIQKSYSDFPITDKQDKAGHGIGLISIKSIAEKYCGGVDWVVKNKKFILTVMMKNERSVGDEF